MTTGQTYTKFRQNFICIWANLLRTFGHIFCSFGQALAILLGKFALTQTGLGNFAPAQILEGTVYTTL